MKKYLFLITPFILDANVHIMHKEFHITKPIKSWIEFKNENLTRQDYDYSCGSASLSTVMKHYYDQNISEKDVLDAVLKMKGLNKDLKRKLEDEDIALSFMDLSEYVKTIGYKAIGLALDIKALKKLKAPVILFVKIRKDEHFTVFRSMDEDNVYLSDPSFGNMKIRMAKFKEMFYQREDLKYPGKILAIVPINKTQVKRINHSFMNIQKNSNFIYENIKNKISRTR
jgi:predicted double-glycine peptidase